jgi:Sulfotransferase domain
MRSWGNREDTLVIDEPFYGHYLAATDAAHPGRDEVMAHHECDWRKVAADLHAPLPPGTRVFYQKHMSHHLLPNMGREWLDGLTHVFLIRNPREMLLSLDERLETFALPDTGLPQQVEIFDTMRRQSDTAPPVIDSRDLLTNPEALWRKLCERLGVPFTPRMLSWPAGRRDTDGIWAKHWYDQVERSTCFAPYRAKTGELPSHLDSLERECRPYYEQLYAHRLTA